MEQSGNGTDALRTGERKIVTILFSDMKDFTRQTSGLDPEELDSLMNSIFGLFESVVLRHEGTVEKYIGDALVAVFGVPKVHEDDAVRAVSAAMDFLSALTELSARFENLEIGFRTGIHTGLVTTGRRGGFPVVTGPAMSMAARLEAAAPTGGILVSAAVREKCVADFSFSPPHELTVKGFAKPVPAYTVIERGTQPAEYATPFIGRTDPLDAMLKAYLRSNPAQTAGAFITGDPGIGKTRLATEFVARLKEFPSADIPLLYARGKRFGSRAFSTLTDLISGYFSLGVNTNAGEIVEILQRRIRLDPEIGREVAEILRGTAGKTGESRTFMFLYLVLSRVVGGFGESPYGPVLFIDNLPEMDTQSRDFFRYYLKTAGEKPFFLFTGRKEDEELRELFPDLLSVQLQPLTREESRELAEAIRADSFEAEFIPEILKNAEGNPLFIEEYVKYARQHRDVRALPHSVQNIFLSALEKYEPNMREFLKKTAVFLHSFTLEDGVYIEERTGGNPLMVPAVLSFFEREGLLMNDNGTFAFRLDLVRKTLYESLLNHNKKIIHRHIADLLKSREHPNRMRLIHHLMRAEEYEEADEALFRDPAYIETLEYAPYLDALIEQHSAADEETRVRYLFTKSAILFNNGLIEQSEAAVKSIIHDGIAKRDERRLGAAYHVLTGYHLACCEFGKALNCAEAAKRYYRRIDPSHPGIRNILGIEAEARLLQNDIEGSIRAVSEMADREDERFSLKELDTFFRHLLLGEYAEAEQVLSRPYTVPERDEALEELSPAINRVRLDIQLCEYERARSTLEAILPTEMRITATRAELLASAAIACHGTGDTAAAGEYLNQAEFTSLQITNEFQLIRTSAQLAEAFLLCGYPEKAAAIAERGIEIGVRNSCMLSGFTLLMILVELSHAADSSADMKFFLQEAGCYADSGVFLKRRDLILYRYFSSIDTGSRSGLAEAGRLLAEELDSIPGERSRERFLSTRSYGEIFRQTTEKSLGR